MNGCMKCRKEHAASSRFLWDVLLGLLGGLTAKPHGLAPRNHGLRVGSSRAPCSVGPSRSVQ